MVDYKNMYYKIKNNWQYIVPTYMKLVNFAKFSNNTYLIYTLGKVGSKTIYKTLLTQLAFNKIFHIHFLTNNNLKKVEDFTKNRESTKKQRKVQKFLMKTSSKRHLKIISLVRDPISINISNLFQNIEVFIPNKPKDEIDFFDLHLALNKINFLDIIGWFDSEFFNYTGIDIYKTPFDKKKGYSIISNNNLDVLLIKLESLNSCYREALEEFTGLDFPKLINTNMASEKKEASKYKKFKKKIKFEEEELDTIYSHKFSRHFYSNEELQSFKDSWLK